MAFETFEITTNRLILKSITPALINEFFNTKTKPEIIQFFGFDESGYNHLKEMNDKGMETHRISLFFFLLIDKASNRPIGDCGYHLLNRTHRKSELFYVLRKDSDKRKGYMTEALYPILNFGFNQLQLHRIEAMVDSSNIPSVKLLLRYGFTKEATLRENYNVNGKNEDSDGYALLKHEWNLAVNNQKYDTIATEKNVLAGDIESKIETQNLFK